ncbi:MAG TPA: AMP-binding protein [Kiritimatiellia bacterium]|nr:AMP-binding protein [Kiritimatiellia bacterium]HMP34741.1 AMP-binding protein [Kiritimatiellia bacterium]
MPLPPWTDDLVASSLLRRFSSVVEQVADLPAVIDPHAAITYRTLDAESRRLAAHLAAHGAAHGCGVALLLPAGCSFAISIWAVLRTGAYYIPLDAAYPAARLAEILGTGIASLLVTDAAHAPLAADIAGRLSPPLTVLLAETPPAEHHEPPAATPAPDDPACVIFTSGSTDQPKGVMQSHRNLLHSTRWYTEPAGLRPGLRMTLLHSVSAIAAATAFYGALLNGATLYPANVTSLGVERLPDWLDEHRIDVLHLVPTLLRRIDRVMPPGRRLRTPSLLRTGGEAVSLADWHTWRSRLPAGSRLLVCLGSTEALNYRQRIHTWDESPPGDALPVGDPMPDKEVAVVDAEGQPVRDHDEVGEIVVASPYIFAGYWKHPALTAQVLRDDPDRPGWRIFRTGDLGRWGADGALFHVGRNDRVIKIMGHRVHPGDIEAVIRTMPGVRDVSVVGEADADGPLRLCAHLVPSPGERVSAASVRRWISRRLPAHMVPSLVEFRADLPRLPGGKVDRRSLRSRRTAARRVHIPPRHPYEETLAEQVKRHLHVADLGMADDLFGDLGADSMAVTSLLMDIHAVFGVQVPLAVVYRETTVAALAGWLRGNRIAPAGGALVIHAAGERPPLFAVCGLFGHALRLLLVGRELPAAQPMIGLEPPGMDWTRVGASTIEDMADWYAGEIMRRRPDGVVRLFGTSFGGIIVHAVACRLQRAGRTVDLLAMVDTNPPDLLTDTGLDRRPPRDFAEGMTSDDPMVQAGIRVARQHGAALARHVSTERFAGVITYFRCDEVEDPSARDRRDLWHFAATKGLDVIPVPGHHGHFHIEPQRSAVVRGLCERLC